MTEKTGGWTHCSVWRTFSENMPSNLQERYWKGKTVVLVENHIQIKYSKLWIWFRSGVRYASKGLENGISKYFGIWLRRNIFYSNFRGKQIFEATRYSFGVFINIRVLIKISTQYTWGKGACIGAVTCQDFRGLNESKKVPLCRNY